jgi:pimeloyl-ACP methyl ester carboxylesterase
VTAALKDGFVTLGGETWEARWIGPAPADAPTLVFLHQGLGCVATWNDFPDKLAAATGCGGFVYSRAGHGKSDPLALPRALDFMQNEGRNVLPRLLDAVGVERAVLVGHSDGASIALVQGGLDHSGRIAGLILEAPHVFIEDLSIDSITKIKAEYETGNLRDRLARHHGDNVDCAFWGWCGAWLNPKSRHWNIEEFLPGISVPILLIQGEDDEYGTPEQLRAIERQAGNRVETLLLPACGHTPHRERTDTVLKAMTDFVAGVVEGF